MEELLARLTAALAGALLLGMPVRAPALEYHALLDLRLVHSSGELSWLDGGAGALRFDGTQDGLRLGELSLQLAQDLGETLRLTVDATTYGDHDRNRIDLTQAYLQWQPWPTQQWRVRAKLGAFYPEISFENVLPNWRSPYSLSWSAIDSWLGEEIRTLGAEYRLEWLGQRNGSAFNVSATLGAFGWNDPAGTLISQRGWALHDRQTTLFGRIGAPGQGLAVGTEFSEIDRRPGYYAGAAASYRDRAQLRFTHYDNRGDGTSLAPSLGAISWQTRFDSAGLQLTPTDHLTLIAQYLSGSTWINPVVPFLWDYDSSFLLASYEQGRLRFTVRRDWFGMQQLKGFGANRQSGSAWTAATIATLSPRWSVAAEALYVDSRLALRSELGAAPYAAEHSLQLSLRYAIDGATP